MKLQSNLCKGLGLWCLTPLSTIFKLTCIKKSPLGQSRSGLLRQVTS